MLIICNQGKNNKQKFASNVLDVMAYTARHKKEWKALKITNA